MNDYSLYYSLGWIILGATLLVVLTRRFQTPSIVAYIAAGLFLGPVFGLIEVSEVLHLIAEVGIALLLFLVGLELSLEKIKDVGKVAFVAGIGQVVFTAFGGYLLCQLLGYAVMESIFLATALTFSSTVVVVKLLDQKKALHSLYGRIAVGIFLVQDMVVIVALTFLAGLGQEGSLEPSEVAGGLGRSFAGMGGLLVLALVASRYLLPKPLAWIARSAEGLFIASVAWCFLFVVLAEWLELSPEIGAFLAGISLAQLPFAHPLQRAVHPVMNFFIMVFFVTLGIQMEIGAAFEQWQAALILSLFVLIGNPFIFMVLIVLCRFDERTAFMTSVTVAQISEFSFIFGAMGVQNELIEPSVLSVIAFVGLVTIVVSSYMILYNEWLYEFSQKLGILKVFRASQIQPEHKSQDLKGHIVVVGMNGLGRGLVERLHERGETTLAVDTDYRKLEGLPGKQIMANIDELVALDEVHLAEAALVISALQIEDTNSLLAYRCKQLGVPCSIHAFDRSVLPELEKLKVDYLIRSKLEGHRCLLDEISTLEASS